MATLKLENIDKIYDNGFHAVYGFNMEIKDGEFIVFVGPSGCGKSTTLRMIAGLEDISGGKLYINDEIVNNMNPKARGIAMVFQSYALYPHLTVYGNMAFGLELEGYDGEFIEKRVHKTAEILGLSQYLGRLPRELSGGQRQRVAVGRAIIREPKVFLMDEPLSNLDAKQRVSMRAEIKDIHRKTKATTIYVTHDQVEAMTMADRIVVMKDGYVQQIGTPYELYFNPVNKFVAGFLGEPPMNFIGAEAKGDLLILDSGETIPANQLKTTLSGNQKYTFGFRPETASLIKNKKAEETGTAVFNGTVELTELLGDSVNIYVRLNESRIIIKCIPEDEPEAGAEIAFSIPYESIYIFDAEQRNIKIK